MNEPQFVFTPVPATSHCNAPMLNRPVFSCCVDVLLRGSVFSTLHFESGHPWFVKSAISILLTTSDGGHVVGLVFLSRWAKRRLSMSWSSDQRDANRHNRFYRGITFDGGGRFMHRCQHTSEESCGVLKRQHFVKV